MTKLYYLLLISFLLINGFNISIYAISPTIDNAARQQEDSILITNYLGLAEKFIEDIELRDSAIYYLNKALDISIKSEEEIYLYNIYSRFSDLFRKTGNYSVSIDYSFRMLKIMDTRIKVSGDSGELEKEYEKLYRDIAYLFSMNDLEKSSFYLRRSLEASQNIHQQDSTYSIKDKEFIVYNNLGTLFLQERMLDSAEYYFSKAMWINKELDNKRYSASVYNNFGTLNAYRKNHEEAAIAFNNALALHQEIGDTTKLEHIYLNLANCSFVQGDYKEALRKYNMGLRLARKNLNIKTEADILASMAFLYEETGDYKKANETWKLTDLLKDSIASVDKIKNSLYAEMQYQYEKKREENELKQQIELAKKEQKALMYIFITVALLFLLIIVLSLYRNQRLKTKQSLIEKESLALKNENLKLKNQTLQENLQTKENELKMHAQYLLKKNEYVSSVMDKISTSKEKNPNKVDDVIKEIKSDIEESVWNEFKILFQNLHQDFYNNLYERHPDLTSNEKKLCTFIRLNLSTKEISSITFQQVKTIEIARSRLRAKLNLKRNENLTSYLQQF